MKEVIDRPAERIRTTSMPGIGKEIAAFNRLDLSPGAEVSGPCLVEEVDTSFFVPASARGRVDPYANLLVTLRQAESLQ